MATNISDVKELVAPDVLPCPDPIVNREVVSIILEFCKKTNILRKEFEFTYDEDDVDDELQDSVDFDLREFVTDMRPVTVVGLMIDSTLYIPKKRNIVSDITNFSTVNDEDYKYFWIPDNNTIRIFDVDTTDEKEVWMDIAFKPLRTATTIDDDLFEDWSEAFVAGAKWKILQMPGKDWTDLNAAEIYRREYRRYLSQAVKASVAGGTVANQNVYWKQFGDIDWDN